MEYTSEKCLHCERVEKEKMDILFKVLDHENDVTVTDGAGVILRISESYEEHYSVKKEDVVGQTVYQMEKKGIFNPSVTILVLKENRKITVLQTNRNGEKILTTGVPIFREDGSIQYVVSFQSIDIAEMSTIKEQYQKLNELMKEYNEEINQLRMREIHDKNLIANSRSMRDISELIFQIADTDANVLITGETGVGKSTIAKIIHQASNRRNGPFIEINCGTIPETLIESELFGYERGAFTGANTKGKVGKIELARGGTLFLDEIGELPHSMQIKFLHVIQERVISRVGGVERLEVDFHLIAATNSEIEKDVESGAFREDLFYRLNVIPIHIPPLRERKEDIISLVDLFLEKFNVKYRRNIVFSPEVLFMLQNQPWPGNIRQLENIIERVVITARESPVRVNDFSDNMGLVRIRDLPNIPKQEEFVYLDENIQETFLEKIEAGSTNLEEILQEYEKRIFTEVLRKYKTSVAVGKALGISQSTAARRLRKYVPSYAENTKEN